MKKQITRVIVTKQHKTTGEMVKVDVTEKCGFVSDKMFADIKKRTEDATEYYVLSQEIVKTEVEMTLMEQYKALSLAVSIEMDKDHDAMEKAVASGIYNHTSKLTIAKTALDNLLTSNPSLVAELDSIKQKELESAQSYCDNL